MFLWGMMVLQMRLSKKKDKNANYRSWWCKYKFPNEKIADSNPQPIKINLNKKLDSKKKTIHTFNIDSQGFRKTKTENPLTWEIRVTC